MLLKSEQGSLARRLALTSLVVLPLFLIAASFFLYQGFKASLEDGLQNQMQSQLYSLLSDAELEGDELWMPEQTAQPGFNQLSSGQYAWVQSSDKLLWQSASAALLAKQVLAIDGPITPGAIAFELPADSTPYFRLTHDVRWQTEQGERLLRFVVAHDPEALYSVLSRFSRQIIYGCLLVSLLLLFVQLGVTRWGLKPLQQIADELAQLESGEIKTLNGQYPSELTQVVSNLNQVLVAQRTQRIRFKNTLADLAHSLKTPLALLQSNAQSPSAELIAEQVSRMDNIITYQLNRAHLGYQPLAEKVAVRPLVERIANALVKLDAYAHIQFEILVEDSLHLNAEEGDLMEVFGNLLENACKYGKSRVEVSSSRSEGVLSLLVEDDGPGIAPHLQTMILKRGARSDTASLGQGLGLAVVTDILSHYGGELNISNSHLGGACVAFSLPDDSAFT